MIETMQTDDVDIKLNFNQPQTSLKTDYQELSTAKDIQVVLLCVENDSFKQSGVYDLKLLGKSMKDWVLNAVKDYDTAIATLNFKDDFLPVVKQQANVDKKYTLVLFSDAPLIRSSTISQIVEYFVIKDLSVLKFTRGYMFKTEYLLTIDKLLSPQMQYFEEEDFITAYNLKQFALIGDILKSRILSYHQKNGVIICDPTSTIIEADASIEQNVTICAGSKILGNSILKQGAKISYNAMVDSSLISENSTIENSSIFSSIVGKNCVIKNYCVVENKSVVGDNSKLLGFNHINGKTLPANSILDSFEKKN